MIVLIAVFNHHRFFSSMKQLFLFPTKIEYIINTFFSFFSLNCAYEFINYVDYSINLQLLLFEILYLIYVPDIISRASLTHISFYLYFVFSEF